MFIVISQTSPEPMYQQVTDQIKDAIAEGSLKPGARLPSVRQMVEELKISSITVKRAYADLENQGYIMTRAGLGTFVAQVDPNTFRNEKIKEIQKILEKVIRTSEKYGITPGDVIALIREIEKKNQ